MSLKAWPFGGASLETRGAGGSASFGVLGGLEVLEEMVTSGRVDSLGLAAGALSFDVDGSGDMMDGDDEGERTTTTNRCAG